MPVSAICRNNKPNVMISHSAKPNGVQWRLCWAANSSGSGAGGGGATSVTHTSRSSSSCMALLLFQRGAVLLGHTCGCGAHGPEAVVCAIPFRSHQGRLAEHPVHAVKIVGEPEHEFADQIEVEPRTVAGRHRTLVEFIEAPAVRGSEGEV